MKIKALYIPLILFGLATSFSSCFGDQKKKEIEEPKDISATIQESLPDPCTFMDEAFISTLVDLPVENVTIKDGGSSSTVPAKSCFFKWSGGEVANAGIMVQALGNPIADEFPDWAFFFIDNKKAQGEKTVEEPDRAHKFTSITDLGDQACYNYELGKCYFRIKGTIYHIALNGISNNDAKMKTFRTVADNIISQL